MNQFLTLSVFFHSFTFSFSEKVVFIFCNICLLILPITFFAGVSNFVDGRFENLSLQSFNVTTLLPVPLISILSMMLAYLACLNPFFLIFVVMCLSVFLYLDVITFCRRFEYSSLQRRYVFDNLLAAVKVLFDDRMTFKSLANEKQIPKSR